MPEKAMKFADYEKLEKQLGRLQHSIARLRDRHPANSPIQLPAAVCFGAVCELHHALYGFKYGQYPEEAKRGNQK